MQDKPVWSARLFLALSLTLFLALAGPLPATATIYTVTNTDDSGLGSLRWAMEEASTSAGNTITFAGSLNGQSIYIATPIAAGAYGFDLVMASGQTVFLRPGYSSGQALWQEGSYASGGGLVVFGNVNLTENISGQRLIWEKENASYIVGYGGGADVWGDLAGQSGLVSGNNLTVRNLGSGNATARGGGLYVQGDISALFSGALSGNRATATSQGGNAHASGGGLFVGEGISGAFSGTLSGNLALARAEEGAAAAQGGGGYVFEGPYSNITGGLHRYNRAEAWGGEGSRAQGGAWFFNTTHSSQTANLRADSAAPLIFFGNTVSLNGQSAFNDLHFGRYDPAFDTLDHATLNITSSDAPGASGVVSLLGGVSSDLNNSMNMIINLDGSSFNTPLTLHWGGANSLQARGGRADINFAHGLVYLQSDFTLHSGRNNDTELHVFFNGDTRLGLNFAGRDPSLAAFDFNGAGAKSWGGSPSLPTVLAAPRSFQAFSGRYLLVDGYDGNVSHDFILPQLVATALGDPLAFKYALDDSQPGQLYVDLHYNPYLLPGLSAPGPNAARAGAALDQWSVATPEGAGLNPEEFERMLAQVNAIPPEQGALMAQVALSLHGLAVDTALQRAFEQNPFTAGPASLAPASRAWSGALNTIQRVGPRAGALGLHDRFAGMNGQGRLADGLSPGLQGLMQNVAARESLLSNWSPAAEASRGLLLGADADAGLGNLTGPQSLRLWSGAMLSFGSQDKKCGYAGYNSDTLGSLSAAHTRSTGTGAGACTPAIRTPTSISRAFPARPTPTPSTPASTGAGRPTSG